MNACDPDQHKKKAQIKSSREENSLLLGKYGVEVTWDNQALKRMKMFKEVHISQNREKKIPKVLNKLWNERSMPLVLKLHPNQQN